MRKANQKVKSSQRERKKKKESVECLYYARHFFAPRLKENSIFLCGIVLTKSRQILQITSNFADSLSTFFPSVFMHIPCVFLSEMVFEKRGCYTVPRIFAFFFLLFSSPSFLHSYQNFRRLFRVFFCDWRRSQQSL